MSNCRLTTSNLMHRHFHKRRQTWLLEKPPRPHWPMGGQNLQQWHHVVLARDGWKVRKEDVSIRVFLMKGSGGGCPHLAQWLKGLFGGKTCNSVNFWGSTSTQPARQVIISLICGALQRGRLKKELPVLLLFGPGMASNEVIFIKLTGDSLRL